MTGIELIAAERQRQITEEGWSAENDAKYTKNELVLAAVCYLVPTWVKTFWPWRDFKWWKPSPDTSTRNLEKAGALIAAEIDRRIKQQSYKIG